MIDADAVFAKEQARINAEQVHDNLLHETIQCLTAHGKTTDDVEWVAADGYWFTWDEFSDVADVNYDAGFGIEEIVPTLTVVGSDWWMERAEYDGSEWWDYQTKPQKPDTHRTPALLTRRQAEHYYGWDDRVMWEDER